MAPSEKATKKVVGAFISLGNGLRVEEIAGATGLAESTVRDVLTHKPAAPALPDFYDRGAEGWSYDPFVSPRTRTFDDVCRPGWGARLGQPPPHARVTRAGRPVCQ